MNLLDTIRALSYEQELELIDEGKFPGKIREIYFALELPGVTTLEEHYRYTDLLHEQKTREEINDLAKDATIIIYHSGNETSCWWIAFWVEKEKLTWRFIYLRRYTKKGWSGVYCEKPEFLTYNMSLKEICETFPVLIYRFARKCSYSVLQEAIPELKSIELK